MADCGWTVDTLKEYLLSKIVENDKRYTQQFENSTTAVNAALAAAKEAVTKAETATEKRFENVNEFRGTLADQQRTFIPRSEVDLLVTGLNSRCKWLEEQVNSAKAAEAGGKNLWAYIIGAVGLIVTLVNFVSMMLKK